MGMFKQKVRVSNSKNRELFFEEEFWVDTGALYSFVPEDRLEQIAVGPSATRNLILADGRQETRLLGFCDFQIEGLEGIIPCPVIFAPKGSLFLLGATALENFGVEVDPIHKRLKPILAVIGELMVVATRRRARYLKTVEETTALYKKEGRPLPPPTSGKDYANKMLVVA